LPNGGKLYWHARWDRDPEHKFLRDMLFETLMDMEDPAMP
jgi:hypothetical protein